MTILKGHEKSSPIHFESQLVTINAWTILRLPLEVSAKLPSRGMTMVKGTINNIPFQTELEPDGKGSHWFNVNDALLKAAHAAAGDNVSISLESTNEWPEPKVPEDVKTALEESAPVYDLWNKITPMARWDWLRWIGSTKQPGTRKRRIEVTYSKLKKSMRRPCCFNRNLCCEPAVSSNGVLLYPR